MTIKIKFEIGQEVRIIDVIDDKWRLRGMSEITSIHVSVRRSGVYPTYIFADGTQEIEADLFANKAERVAECNKRNKSR